MRKITLCLFAFSSVCFLYSCKKNKTLKADEDVNVSSYEQQKAEIAKLVEEIRNRKRTIGTYNSSNSWSKYPTGSLKIPIPDVGKFLLCGSSQSPAGPSFSRFHYQITLDNDTRKYIRDNWGSKKLELRFYTSSMAYNNSTGWKIDVPNRPNGFPFEIWPGCIYLDYDNSGGVLAIPDKLIASIVSKGAGNTSGYKISFQPEYGWNGIIDFPTPPTYAISKSNYLEIHPDAYTPNAPCQ